MTVISRTVAILPLLLLTILTATITAQQKRQTPAKPQPKAPAAAPTPTPTFDTLLPADAYVIYGEVRSAGQLVRSSAINELLEPVLKLAGPPKEFKNIVKWLNAHADELMSSRLFVATWRSNPEVPETIVAIEFASAEEAAKFATPLSEFLPTVLPTPAPEPSPTKSKTDTNTSAAPEKPKPATPAKPNFHLQRMGSLVLISPKPWTMKQLRPAGSKLLAEEVNFRAARNRFNSEPVFVYIDLKAIEREEEERRKRNETSERAEAEQAKREEATATAAAAKTPDSGPEKPDLTAEERAALEAEVLAATTTSSPEAKEAPTPDPISMAMTGLASSFFGGEQKWPDGVALSLSFDGESFDLRALLVNAPGKESDTIPFWPRFIPAAAMTHEAPSILPADTEFLITLSVDLPRVYAEMSKPIPQPQFIRSSGDKVTVNKVDFQSPFAALEDRLKINIKDDLLPLLGSEIAVRLPMQGMGMLGGLPVMIASAPQAQVSETSPGQSPVLAIAVKDRERLRALLPKLVESFGFKGASAFAQTERREDTELVSYANIFSYAFVGNFIVVSADPATTRHVVDSYLKHETLASDSHFRNYTRWQPRPSYGQIYISPALMEGYKTWATAPNTRMSDQARAFMTRASTVAQPITYSLSNEGFGPLHELHLPKNLIMIAVAGISGEMNPSPAEQSERSALGMMYRIAHAQEEYKTKKGNGSCGTLEDLIAADLIPKDAFENSGYKFEVTVSGDKYQVSAVPVEYGKTGKMSYFMDETRMLRGGDRNGAAATASDPPIF